MKLVVKRNRELAPINSQNTQNENKAEIIELIVPEEFESFNKKIVFITPNETVWDVIVNNQYKITNAITQYDKVDYYIWLTKEVDGESIDFRTKTKTLNFYHNEDASDEITDEEIHGVNTVVNLLEEEIEKVENLNIEATKVGNTTTVTITKKDGTTESVEINDGTDGQDGQDGYTPQKGIDYFTEQDIEEIEGDILNEVYTKSETDTLLQEKADVEDIPDVSSFITKDVNNLTNYTLKTNTGSLIDLEINDTTYVVTLKLKNQDGTIISTDTIDLPLESVVVSGRYDNTTKKVILTLENGSEVDFSVADLVAGLQTEITSQNKLASDLVDDTNSGNKFVTTSEKQTWNDKLDESDLTDYVKNTDYANSSKGGVIRPTDYYGVNISSNGRIMGIDDTYTRYNSYYPREAFISKGMLENVIAGKQLINQTQLEESQETQDEEIEKLQTENARFKATLPTTTGEGKEVTLNKTAELEFKKPPLPMGNSEQESTTGKNLLQNKAISKTEKGITATKNEDGTVTLSGTATDTFAMDISGSCDLLAGTYIISGCPTGGSASTYRIMMWNSSWSYISQDIGNSGTFTLENDTTNNKISIQVYSGTTINNLVFKPMIRLASITDDTYEPYTNGASPNPDYPQEITNVTGDVEVVVENKNFFVPQTIVDDSNNAGVYLTNDGYIRYKTGANSLIIKPNLIKENIGYTFKMIGKSDTNNKNTIRFYAVYTDGTSEQAFSTVRSNTEEFAIFFTTNANKTLDFIKSVWTDELVAFIKIDEAMILEGVYTSETIPSYVPHKEQTFTFPLGNEKLMLGDYLADDGIHHVRGQIVLDGTENWLDTNVSSVGYSKKYITIINEFKSRTEIICTHFKNLTNIANVNNTTIIGKAGISYYDNNYLYFGVEKQTNQEWKAYLAEQHQNGTPVIAEYKLAEEIIVPYTSTQQEVYNQIKQALSYEEQTNISSNTIALFNVEAYQDAKVILAEKGTYSKPSTGIPKSDLASAVQTSLNKADTSIQQHQDISGKQDKTDNNLTTINKTIVGAINEKADIINNELTGSTIYFTDGINNSPVNKLIVNIEPVQEGSGTPTPNNVRNIIGWNAAIINHSGADTQNPNVLNVSWQNEAGIVYGGTLNVATGLLTVTKALVELAVADMNNTEAYPGWKNTGIESIIGIGINQKFTSILNIGDTFSANTTSGTGTIFLPRSTYGLTQEQWKEQYPNLTIQIIAEYQNPETYQLTPHEIRTLLGINNFWANTGDVTVNYKADTKLYIDSKFQSLEDRLSLLEG